LREVKKEGLITISVYGEQGGKNIVESLDTFIKDEGLRCRKKKKRKKRLCRYFKSLILLENIKKKIFKGMYLNTIGFKIVK